MFNTLLERVLRTIQHSGVTFRCNVCLHFTEWALNLFLQSCWHTGSMVNYNFCGRSIKNAFLAILMLLLWYSNVSICIVRHLDHWELHYLVIIPLWPLLTLLPQAIMITESLIMVSVRFNSPVLLTWHILAVHMNKLIFISYGHEVISK